MDHMKVAVLGASKIAIAGHIRPDGDCIGSCTALYQYLIQNKEEFQIDQVDVYLEPFGNEFHMLAGLEEIKHSFEKDEDYDLFISLDCGSLDRLGKALKYYTSAKKTINIDHHISNQSFGMINYVVVDASSTCEVLFGLMEEEKITKEIATSLYVGIIHDTGVFKHSNTSRKTMNIAGVLLEKGINHSYLIDETFYSRTGTQNQILGRCLMESRMLFDGKIIVSSINRNILELYQGVPTDLDGIIDQLRIVKGVEVAIFIYQLESQEYKVSLRSNGPVNVSQIAVHFGGGGHIKAAGCTMIGTVEDITDQISKQIIAQLNGI